jgi:chromosome segregation ATPase
MIESEKTIHLLQKENEKLKFELENPSGLVIPKETQLKLTELESLVQQLQTKDELNQETLVALLNDKKELEANVVRLQSTHNDLISTNNDKNAEMEKVQVVLNDLEKKYKNTKQELDTLKMCDFETSMFFKC